MLSYLLACLFKSPASELKIGPVPIYSLLLQNSHQGDDVCWENSSSHGQIPVTKEMYSSMMAPQRKRHRVDGWWEEPVSWTSLCSWGCKAANGTVWTKNKYLLKTTAKYHSTLCSHLSNPKNLVLYHHEPLTQLPHRASGVLPQCCRGSLPPHSAVRPPSGFFLRCCGLSPSTLTLEPLQQRGKKKKAGSLLRPCLRSPLLPPNFQSLPSELF